MMTCSVVVAVAAGGLPGAAVSAAAPVPRPALMSANGAGVQGNDLSTNSQLSADGRYVAFETYVPLVAIDTNDVLDVYVKDRLTGEIELISVEQNPYGPDQAVGQAWSADISADGRYVVFETTAQLTDDEVPAGRNVYRRDRLTSSTVLVSERTSSDRTNRGAAFASISGDGKLVAYTRLNYVTEPPYFEPRPKWQIYLRDVIAGTLTLVSAAPGGGGGNGRSERPDISENGRYVAFSSNATNLDPADTDFWADIYLWDRVNGHVEVISTGVHGNVDDEYVAPSISADGQLTVFGQEGYYGYRRVFLWDMFALTTEEVSVNSNWSPDNSGSARNPVISGNGRYVGWTSSGTNLDPYDTDPGYDIFVRDLVAWTTVRVSTPGGGTDANEPSGYHYSLDGYTRSGLNHDGSLITFTSLATNIAPDSNQYADVFAASTRPPGPPSVTNLHCESHSARITCDMAHAGGVAPVRIRWSFTANRTVIASMNDLTSVTRGCVADTTVPVRVRVTDDTGSTSYVDEDVTCTGQGS